MFLELLSVWFTCPSRHRPSSGMDSEEVRDLNINMEAVALHDGAVAGDCSRQRITSPVDMLRFTARLLTVDSAAITAP